MSSGVGGGGNITTDHHRSQATQPQTIPGRDQVYIKPEYLNYEIPVHHLYPSSRDLIDYNNYTSAAAVAAAATAAAVNSSSGAPLNAALNLECNFQRGQSQQPHQQQQGNTTQSQQEQQQLHTHPLHQHLSTQPTTQSTRAQKEARRRSNETPEARERRLERNAARMRERRARETEEEYRLRLAKNAEANRARRRNRFDED